MGSGALAFLAEARTFLVILFFAMKIFRRRYHPAKVYLCNGRWTRRERIVSITRTQRRKVNRKAGDLGLGVSLRTPLEAGASLVIRTNLDPKRANLPRRVLVNWCEEKPDGTFQAGLQFV